MDVISSRNVYIDSDRGIQGDGKHFTLHFPSNAFTVGDGQMMRVTLQSFSMYKNFYNVNDTNRHFKVVVGNTTVAGALTPKDYKDYGAIATDFAEQLRVALASGLNTEDAADFGALSTQANSVEPAADVVPGDTSTRAFKVIYNATKADGTAYNIGEDFTTSTIKVLFEQDVATGGTSFQDTHELLGGKVSTPGATVGGLQIAFANNAGTNDQMIVTGYFPMQRSTMEHVYLRSTLITDNYQNHHFDSSVTLHDSHLTSSDILAKLAVYDEFVVYSDMNSSGTGFFVNLPNKSLTSATFRLTDDKDRTLPLVATDQASLGNVSVNMVLRFDVLEHRVPKQVVGEGRMKSTLATRRDI
jgi:hypothetical protein